MVEVPTIRWRWEGEQPWTQALVASFGNHFGDEPGQLPGDALAGYLTDAMPGVEALDARFAVGAGADSVQAFIATHFEKASPSTNRRSILRIGALAGTVACRQLAGQVDKDMYYRRTRGMMALRVLSEYAIFNLNSAAETEA